MLKENKGITLIALIVTIIILLILSGIGVAAGRASVKTAKDNKAKVELDMVQHAVLERYSKYKLINDESVLIGTKITYLEAEGVSEQMDRRLPDDGTYYRLMPEDLELLGISQDKNQYIVNYEKGIVLNETIKTTYAGESLYKDTDQ